MSADVLITGIGLLSGLGEGGAAHWEKLSQPGARPVVDEQRFAPYPVHPLGSVDFSTQIAAKADLRQMEPWQRIGVFAAGLALADAGLAGRQDYLDRTDLIVAAGSGERDTATDMKVLETIGAREDGDIRANEILPSNLRPTLFLAQLSNLLAGNISIVHKVTGSSRTFMGEEMAGVAAVETAVRRIKAGQGSLFLVGGAFNAEREDALLNFELGGMLHEGLFAPVWERAGTGAGLAPASVGAFLVLEERSHAEARGAEPYARIDDVRSGRCNRRDGAASENARTQFCAVKESLREGPLPVLSGASGVAPTTEEELAFLEGLAPQGFQPAVRAYGSLLGHGIEAHFPLGVALAALALRHGSFYPPFASPEIERESRSGRSRSWSPPGALARRGAGARERGGLGMTHDHRGRPVVAVTGLGVVTSLGQGVADNWRGLTAGQSGLRRITRFPTTGLRSDVAGCIDFMGPEPYSAYGLSLALARAVAHEAIAQSAIGSRSAFPGPLYIATPPSELEWPHLRALYAEAPRDGSADVYRGLAAAARNGGREAFAELAAHVRFAALAEALADDFGTAGQPVSICTACASGVTAIQLGLEAIRRGETEAALCMGVDATVHPEGLVRFALLSALSTHCDPPEKASRPFAKDRNGFVIAEGAAALVLESYDAAKARGARVLGIVRGCGERADHYHRTRSKPDGSAIVGAVAGALEDAGTRPDQIDYVNAHGTGTPENDKMEYLALKAVFGDAIHGVPISSNKSMIGHRLIAAGAVEAVFSLMTIGTGTLPPTMNCDVPDPAIPLDVVANAKRDWPVTTVLSNSFGFGGQNACAVFSAEPG